MAPAPVLAPPSAATWRDHVIGIDDLVTVLAGQPGAPRQPRQRRQHAGLGRRRRRRDPVPPVVRQRAPGHRPPLPASTAAFELAREVVGAFVGADPRPRRRGLHREHDRGDQPARPTVPIPTGSVVLTTVLEHHSNDLPWRARAEVVHVGATADGALDVDDLRPRLARYPGRVRRARRQRGVERHRRRATDPRPRRARARGRRSDRGRRRPAGPAPSDRHAAPRRSRAPRLRRLRRPQAVRPVRQRRARGRRACFGARPSRPGGGTVRAVTLDDVLWAGLPTARRRAARTCSARSPSRRRSRRSTAIGMDRLAARGRPHGVRRRPVARPSPG